MCKFESSQKDENRWQSTDSSKAYSNTSAFKCHCQWFHTFGFYCLLITVGVCACERLLCSTRYQSRKNNRKKTKLLLLEILPLKATASKAYIGNPACIRQEFGDVTDPTKPWFILSLICEHGRRKDIFQGGMSTVDFSRGGISTVDFSRGGFFQGQWKGAFHGGRQWLNFIFSTRI